jgi:uncharacterized protein (DUF885 family)
MLAPICLVFVLLGQPAAKPATPNDAARDLYRLLDAEWEHTMQVSPTWASSLGDRRWNDRWEDISLAAVQREHEHDRQVLARLAKIDRSKLAADEQLDFDLFGRSYGLRVEEFPFGLHLIALNQREGVQTADELADGLRFESVKDYEDWLSRLRGLPAYLDQTTALLREGMKRKIVQPKVTMQRVPAQIARQIVDEPDTSSFFKPFRRWPNDVAMADRERITGQARDVIRNAVIPAYRRFHKFFVDEYLPACFDGVGAWRMADGDKLYAFVTRKHTTTKLTPQEIHDIGQREVKRIRAAMEQVKEQAGFKGSLPEFFHFLRTDPQFYCKTPQELLLTYQALTKRIDPTLVKLFRTHPRMPYGIETIPEKIAPDTTTAYYRPPAADGSRAGSYFVNLYRPETRPKWEMMALSLHEAVPGHHFQIALAQEHTAMPQFRRHGHFTAYIEGWGLYAESLGEDLGLYDDPYSKFGQLTYEMWRAVRLVVDTGIHSLKWERQQAIDFFKENAPKAELDIVNEIDRYISWPGQALAYKIGELKIKELRATARRELGDRFDIREFHDVVLLSGAVPLDILEQRVNDWIKSKSR